MVKSGIQKRKNFKNISDLNKMISKYQMNVSETEAYLRGIKQGIKDMRSLRKDLRSKDVNSVSLSLNPLK